MISYKYHKNKKAFTLIELLIVVTIIGILAGIVTIAMSGSQSKARDARRKSDVNTIWTSAQTYREANESYYVGSDPFLNDTYIVNGQTLRHTRIIASCSSYSVTDSQGGYISTTTVNRHWRFFEDAWRTYLPNGVLPNDPRGRCGNTKYPGRDALTTDYVITTVTNWDQGGRTALGVGVWAQLENRDDPDANGISPFRYRNVNSSAWFMSNPDGTPVDVNLSTYKYVPNLYARGTGY